MDKNRPINLEPSQLQAMRNPSSSYLERGARKWPVRDLVGTAIPTGQEIGLGAVKQAISGDRAAGNPANQTGFLILDASCNLLYANQEAIRVLSYPGQPGALERPRHLTGEKIRALLFSGRSTRAADLRGAFLSGKRRYRWGSTELASTTRVGPAATLAVLIERDPCVQSDAGHVAQLYKLTRREQELVERLIEGLTSKEIAARMGISQNTVKAFVRLVMAKMGVSTRTGIVGKVVEHGGSCPAASFMPPIAIARVNK